MANPADKNEYWKRNIRDTWYEPESIKLLTDEQRQALIRGVEDGSLVVGVMGFGDPEGECRITGFSLAPKERHGIT